MVVAFAASPALAATQACHPKPPCVAAECVYVRQVPSSGVCKKKSDPVTTSSAQPTYMPPATVTPTVEKPRSAGRHHNLHPAKPAAQPRTVHVTRAAAHVKPPSAVSAAFDLGFGPTALFAGLLAAAALLAVGGGLRHGRRR